MGPDKQAKHQAPTISSIEYEKSLSQNRHRIWSLTHQRAIKEESKVGNRDWVNHQACSLLQYNNVIANLLLMEIILVNCAEKLLEQTIFFNLYTIEFRFPKSMPQERFTSNLEFRYQTIVSSIKRRKGFAKFMILITLFKKFLS